MSQHLSLESKVKHFYRGIRLAVSLLGKRLTIGFGSTLRFFAIPVAMISSVDWTQCKRNPVIVFFDHLYIFFYLGYFPDNYNTCRLWQIERSEWTKYLGSGYDPRAVFRREKHILKTEHAILFEDKEVCYHLCHSFHLPLPKQYGVIDPNDDFSKIISTYFTEYDAKKIILKSIDGCGGSGIYLVEPQEGKLIVRDASNPSESRLLDQHKVTTRLVAQEFVNQHPILKGISDKTLNTVRIVTLYTPENHAIVVGAYLRIGLGDSFIDNGCQGNAGVNIDIETGKPIGKILTTRHKECNIKYKNGESITEVPLPDWQELLELAEKIQTCFAPFNRFIGMDLAFSDQGPIVIEINDIFDGAYFETYCGPMLANPTVYKACVKYELLPRHLLPKEKKQVKKTGAGHPIEG